MPKLVSMQVVRRESLVEKLCPGLQTEAHAVLERHLIRKVLDLLAGGLDPPASPPLLRLLDPLAPLRDFRRSRVGRRECMATDLPDGGGADR